MRASASQPSSNSARGPSGRAGGADVTLPASGPRVDGPVRARRWRGCRARAVRLRATGARRSAGAASGSAGHPYPRANRCRSVAVSPCRTPANMSARMVAALRRATAFSVFEPAKVNREPFAEAAPRAPSVEPRQSLSRATETLRARIARSTESALMEALEREGEQLRRKQSARI
jgi:hypothetical protein